MLCTGYLPGGLRIDRHGLRLQQQEAHRVIGQVHASQLYDQGVFELVPFYDSFLDPGVLTLSLIHI